MPAATAITGSNGSGVRGPPRRMRSRRTSGSKGTSSTPAAVGVDARSTPCAKRKLGTALVSSGETLRETMEGHRRCRVGSTGWRGEPRQARLPPWARSEALRRTRRPSPLGGELLRNAKACRPRSRVGREFRRSRPDHLAGEEKECGPVDAGAVGLLGWTDTILSCDVECVLYKGVLERVEGDDPKTPTGPEDADCCLQASFEAFELVVHRDAKRLECARRRVNPLWPEPPRHHLLDELTKLRRGGDRGSLARSDDSVRDRSGESLVAVVADHGHQLVRRQGIDKVRRGDPGRRVHAHVERSVVAEAEAAGRV